MQSIPAREEVPKILLRRKSSVSVLNACMQHITHTHLILRKLASISLSHCHTLSDHNFQSPHTNNTHSFFQTTPAFDHKYILVYGYSIHSQQHSLSIYHAPEIFSCKYSQPLNPELHQIKFFFWHQIKFNSCHQSQNRNVLSVPSLQITPHTKPKTSTGKSQHLDTQHPNQPSQNGPQHQTEQNHRMQPRPYISAISRH